MAMMSIDCYSCLRLTNVLQKKIYCKEFYRFDCVAYLLTKNRFKKKIIYQKLKKNFNQNLEIHEQM